MSFSDLFCFCFPFFTDRIPATEKRPSCHPALFTGTPPWVDCLRWPTTWCWPNMRQCLFAPVHYVRPVGGVGRESPWSCSSFLQRRHWDDCQTYFQHLRRDCRDCQVYWIKNRSGHVQGKIFNWLTVWSFKRSFDCLFVRAHLNRETEILGCKFHSHQYKIQTKRIKASKAHKRVNKHPAVKQGKPARGTETLLSPFRLYLYTKASPSDFIHLSDCTFTDNER